MRIVPAVFLFLLASACQALADQVNDEQFSAIVMKAMDAKTLNEYMQLFSKDLRDYMNALESDPKVLNKRGILPEFKNVKVVPVSVTNFGDYAIFVCDVSYLEKETETTKRMIFPFEMEDGTWRIYGWVEEYSKDGFTQVSNLFQELADKKAAIAAAKAQAARLQPKLSK